MILGLSLYEIFLVAGVISALVVFRVLSDKTRLDTRLFNFCLIAGVVAIISGYGLSVIFQAYYNYAAGGVFEITALPAPPLRRAYRRCGGFLDNIFCDRTFRVPRHAISANFITSQDCRLLYCHRPLAGRLAALWLAAVTELPPTPGIYMAYPGNTGDLPSFMKRLSGPYVGLAYHKGAEGKSCNFLLYMIAYGIHDSSLSISGDGSAGDLCKFSLPLTVTAIILILGGLVFGILKADTPRGRRHPAGRRTKMMKLKTALSLLRLLSCALAMLFLSLPKSAFRMTRQSGHHKHGNNPRPWARQCLPYWFQTGLPGDKPAGAPSAGRCSSFSPVLWSWSTTCR